MKKEVILANGTIFITGDKTTCEIIVTPETPDTIAAAIDELREEGIRTTTAQIIGNFAIDLTGDTSLADIRNVLSGEVIE